MCHYGFKASWARTYLHYCDMLCKARVYIGCSVAVDPLSATVVPLHLTQFAVPFVQIVTTVCSHGLLLYTIFLWHVQCMVHGSRALGWFNLLFFEPVGTSPHPAIWLRKVGLLSSQSKPWVDTTWSLKIEHPGCAENQALANHRCSVEHVLLHSLVKYTIRLALQHTFAYTWYNHVSGACTSMLLGRWAANNQPSKCNVIKFSWMLKQLDAVKRKIETTPDTCVD